MPAPLPPEHTRFKPGQSGNPGGKTRAQRQAEIRNAEIATEIRTMILERLRGTLKDETVLNQVVSKVDVLKLLKDTDERGYGSPEQSVDHAITTTAQTAGILDYSKLSSATLVELVEAMDELKADQMRGGKDP